MALIDILRPRASRNTVRVWRILLVVYLFPVSYGAAMFVFGRIPKPNIIDFVYTFAIGLPWSALTLFSWSGWSDREVYGVFWFCVAINVAILAWLSFGLRRA